MRAALLALIFLCGCATHRTITIDVDQDVSDAQDFVSAVSGKMPMWDADSVSRYERVEIATVKADIALARQQSGKVDFLSTVAKLHLDWDALVALDEQLKVMELT